MNELTVEFGGVDNVLFTHESNDWSLALNLDVVAKELIFKVEMQPHTWIAVGLAPDLIEADVIWWEAGSSGYDPADSPGTIQEELLLRRQSKVLDRISVHGVLLENKTNQLRNMLVLNDNLNRIQFTTWRAFDTKDPLDTLLRLDSEVPFSIASGSKNTTWEERTNHGTINLYFNS